MKINTFLLLLLLGGSPIAANAQSLYDNNRQCVTAIAPDVPESMYFDFVHVWAHQHIVVH